MTLKCLANASLAGWTSRVVVRPRGIGNEGRWQTENLRRTTSADGVAESRRSFRSISSSARMTSGQLGAITSTPRLSPMTRCAKSAVWCDSHSQDGRCESRVGVRATATTAAHSMGYCALWRRSRATSDVVARTMGMNTENGRRMAEYSTTRSSVTRLSFSVLPRSQCSLFVMRDAFRIA